MPESSRLTDLFDWMATRSDLQGLETSHDAKMKISLCNSQKRGKITKEAPAVSQSAKIKKHTVPRGDFQFGCLRLVRNIFGMYPAVDFYSFLNLGLTGLIASDSRCKSLDLWSGGGWGVRVGMYQSQIILVDKHVHQFDDVRTVKLF